jgi:hypothetical protein
VVLAVELSMGLSSATQAVWESYVAAFPTYCILPCETHVCRWKESCILWLEPSLFLGLSLFNDISGLCSILYCTAIVVLFLYSFGSIGVRFVVPELEF